MQNAVTVEGGRPAGLTRGEALLFWPRVSVDVPGRVCSEPLFLNDESTFTARHVT
jgi:hypothetical protein